VDIYVDGLLVAGLAGAWIGLTVQHCGNHGAMSTKTWVNKFMGLCDDLIGGSSLMWRYHHQVWTLLHVPACTVSDMLLRVEGTDGCMSDRFGCLQCSQGTCTYLLQSLTAVQHILSCKFQYDWLPWCLLLGFLPLQK
jgi:hypothetical protein